jgi:hypothetical protein
MTENISPTEGRDEIIYFPKEFDCSPMTQYFHDKLFKLDRKFVSITSGPSAHACPIGSSGSLSG